ncbi:EPSP synthase (3-phosphoshikimate 1-carboxyvinyltransferase) domain-containing protein [Phthorimaea operculella]|nr:EPSP synthase (3-phosphoshikimate 1-carboxyvinyltransferase) domain-containing protein [Phthorimaea operculella]
MDCIFVRGGCKLQGSVKIEGAKNAALPILAATLLAENGETLLRKVPMVSDVLLMCQLLRELNATVSVDSVNKMVRVDASNQLYTDALHSDVNKLRASVLVLGPLLARCGRASVASPGGCRIGTRPVQLHLQGLRSLGATVDQHEDHIEAHSPQLQGTNITLKFPSVGATQNIMMAAVKSEGTTTIRNAAKEPEIVDLAEVLSKMGANIHGAGSETITITGVERLHAAEHVVMQDRIEAGTFMIAAALTAGDILVEDAVFDHNEALISKLRTMGVCVEEEAKGIRVRGSEVLFPTDVTTAPYPGFPTDLQAPMSVLLLHAAGTSVVTEALFEDRFQHLVELRRMRAQVRVVGASAHLAGTRRLRGARVRASDLRAAAALVLAGLRAAGTTAVTNLHYLDRGYYKFHRKLQMLGALVERVNA